MAARIEEISIILHDLISLRGQMRIFSFNKTK